MNYNGLKYLVVGSGFSGAVIAERIANDLGEDVQILEQRNHIAGNCYSKVDPESGVEYHVYGPHIFHTSNPKIWEYVNKFTEFNGYRHKVLSLHKGEIYSMPINLATINKFYKKNFTPIEAEAFVKAEIERDKIENPANLEEKAISLIGRPLYEAFIKGYTQKQWETDPRKLPANIITRLPVRFNYNDRYFNDFYEGIPKDGYTKVFERILTNPRISVQTNVDYFAIKSKIPKDCKVIFTGPIDRYFEYKFGVLGWRTIDLKGEVVPHADYLGNASINYADMDVGYTRVHEFKHFHPERQINSGKSYIAKEYSRFATAKDDPYYPIGTEEDKFKFALYQAEAKKEKNVFFVGRLGNYKYMDMHQAIGAALLFYERDLKPQVTGGQWQPVYTNAKDLA